MPGRRRWEVPVLREGTAAAGAEAGQAGLLRAPEEESGTRTWANEIPPRGFGTGVAPAVPLAGKALLRMSGGSIRDRRMTDNEISDKNRESTCILDNGRRRGSERGGEGGSAVTAWHQQGSGVERYKTQCWEVRSRNHT